MEVDGEGGGLSTDPPHPKDEVEGLEPASLVAVISSWKSVEKAINAAK